MKPIRAKIRDAARQFKAARNSPGPDEARCFELFRNALSDVEIWTFDKVVARLEGIRAALASLRERRLIRCSRELGVPYGATTTT